jgi:hypothetical protein
MQAAGRKNNCRILKKQHAVPTSLSGIRVGKKNNRFLFQRDEFLMRLRNDNVFDYVRRLDGYFINIPKSVAEVSIKTCVSRKTSLE